MISQYRGPDIFYFIFPPVALCVYITILPKRVFGLFTVLMNDAGNND